MRSTLPRRLASPIGAAIALSLAAGALAAPAHQSVALDTAPLAPSKPGKPMRLRGLAAAPQVGDKGVVIADPTLPRPAGTPCVIELYKDAIYNDWSGRPFDYPGNAACPGPYAKVILEADFSVTAGRQYDRTASIWLGGAMLYFGTTQEPSSSVAPTWRVERDVTEYASLFATAKQGQSLLGNTVDGTYTGVIKGSGRLLFYPEAKGTPPQPKVFAAVADQVLPLSNSAIWGGPKFLASDADSLSASLQFPSNVTRLYMDLVAQPQASDEFFWTCVPDELAEPLENCPGNAIREVWVRIDGQAAGVAPVSPWVFTGAMDPALWQPTPAPEALNFMPYRIDLTPFAALVSDGLPHTVSITVHGAKSGFATAANLLVYQDSGNQRVTGRITRNTLASQTPGGAEIINGLTSSNGTLSGTLTQRLARSYEIAAELNTAVGKRSVSVQHAVGADNVGTYLINKSYDQQLVHTASGKATTTTRIGKRRFVDTRELSIPLTMRYNWDQKAQTQNISMGQRIVRDSSARLSGGKAPFTSHLENAHTAQASLKFFMGQPIARTSQSSTQNLSYSDSLGSSYCRGIITKNGALTSLTDGCDGQANHIDVRALPDGAADTSVKVRVAR